MEMGVLKTEKRRCEGEEKGEIYGEMGVGQSKVLGFITSIIFRENGGK